MARKPEGWRLVRDKRTGTWFVRARLPDGRRIMRTTGTGDRATAQTEAARIVREASAEVVGRVVTRGAARLDEDLVAAWLEDYAASHSPETVEAFETYAAAHWLPRWRTVESIDPGAYVRERLRVVTASSVRKEASGLRSLLAWLTERGHDVQAVPSVPKRATGTRYEGGLRTPRRVPLSPETMRAIIAALPETTRHGHPARAVVELIWETTLRIATIERLERPRHFRPRAKSLTITADIDKSRYARTLPLSPRARAILDAHATEDGPIFGKVDIRYAMEQAALAAGVDPDDARRVSPHDVRHAAITDLVTRPGASIGGAGYIAGHLHISTTALYAHPGEEAARAALEARNGMPVRDAKRKPKRAK